ncbi:MAG TPA: DUF2948 family protein [Alphaproteobacteria bacterium]|nr:DUF2948 family protein [Alphaproteobacteria bacterium]
MALKLVAEDTEDLKVISTHLQDALVRVGDIAYLPRHHRLAISLNRFCWEAQPSKVGGKVAYARVTSGLHFDGVLGVKARGMDQKNLEGLLYLLSIEPKVDVSGAGVIDLVFAGGATLQAQVECIDATLTDRGEPWLTEQKPGHEEAAPGAGLR